MDERSFDRGFRQRGHSDSDYTYPSFTSCRTHGVSIGEIQRNDWPKIIGVDLSSKKRPGNALVTVAVEPVRRRRFVIDVRYGAWRSNETCEQLNELNDLYRPLVIMVENNGYQNALIEWVEACGAQYRWWMKIEPTTTTQNKMSPEFGLPVLQTEFKHGAWVVPYSEYEGALATDPGRRGQWARWDYEMRQHPIAATSDGVMATWFARQGIEQFIALVDGSGGEVGTHSAR